MVADVVLSKDEKRVLLGLLFWNPETGQLDLEGADHLPIEEVVAMVKTFDFRKAECPKRG